MLKTRYVAKCRQMHIIEKNGSRYGMSCQMSIDMENIDYPVVYLYYNNLL